MIFKKIAAILRKETSRHACTVYPHRNKIDQHKNAL